tara:strand:- start:2298 stop:2642 length:345 start_codon:yes stop_codon:yes gene_type:complete
MKCAKKQYNSGLSVNTNPNERKHMNTNKQTTEMKHPLLGKNVMVFIDGETRCINGINEFGYRLEYICDSHVVLATWEIGYEGETLVMYPMHRIEELDTTLRTMQADEMETKGTR